MEALADAGSLALAPNHKDAGCGGGRYVFGNGTQKPEVPFRDTGKWSDQTYHDRREDMDAVLNVRAFAFYICGSSRGREPASASPAIRLAAIPS